MGVNNASTSYTSARLLKILLSFLYLLEHILHCGAELLDHVPPEVVHWVQDVIQTHGPEEACGLEAWQRAGPELRVQGCKKGTTEDVWHLLHQRDAVVVDEADVWQQPAEGFLGLQQLQVGFILISFLLLVLTVNMICWFQLGSHVPEKLLHLQWKIHSRNLFGTGFKPFTVYTFRDVINGKRPEFWPWTRKRRSPVDMWRWRRPCTCPRDTVDTRQRRIWLSLHTAARPPGVSARCPGPAASPPEGNPEHKRSLTVTSPPNKPQFIRCGFFLGGFYSKMTEKAD